MPPSSILSIEGIDVAAMDRADPEDDVNAEIYLEVLLESEHTPLRWQLLRGTSAAVAQYETPAQAQAVRHDLPRMQTLLSLRCTSLCSRCEYGHHRRELVQHACSCDGAQGWPAQAQAAWHGCLCTTTASPEHAP